MKRITCVLLVSLLVGGCQADQSLEELWQTSGLRTPESVLYHETGDETVLYVSEIDEEGQGGIAKLDVNGEILNQDWVRGLKGPKGMAIHNGKLYVSDITDVAVIDIASQKVEQTIPIADSVFLNDVTVDDAGVVYVSDSETGKVHRLVDGEPEVYLEGLESPNGLKAVNDVLYIGAGPVLYKADANKELTTVAEGFAEGLDGVEIMSNGDFIASSWKGLVYHVTRDGEITELLDTRDEKMNTADIGWNDSEKIVYVPTFFKSSVVAYQLAEQQ